MFGLILGALAISERPHMHLRTVTIRPWLARRELPFAKDGKRLSDVCALTACRVDTGRGTPATRLRLVRG